MSEQLKPELRFPEFDGDWNETTFDSHYSFKPTNSLSRDKLNYEAGIVKNIHYGDIHTEFDLLFDVTEEKVPFINDDINIDNIDDENYVQKGDLVIADASEDYADIGKAIEVINTNNERILAGLHTFLARREDDEVAEGFFAFLLNTYKARYEIMRIAQGTKVLGLSKNRLGEIPLHIPEPEEQQKIVNFLKAIDKRIKLLKAKKEALEEYKISIMQKLFAQEIRFKQDDGSDFPQWEYPKLGLKCKIQNGYAFKSSDFESDGYPIIRISNISNDDNYIDSRNMVRYNRNDIDRKFEINSGDLLIAMSGATTGKVSIFNLNEKAYLNQRVGLFRLIEDGLSYGYLTQYVFSRLFRADIFKLFVEGSQPNISGKDIENFNMPLPHPDEQVKIDSMLSRIDFKIDDLNNKIGDLVEYKTALLQKMFV